MTMQDNPVVSDDPATISSSPDPGAISALAVPEFCVSPQAAVSSHVGIYGWRKRCLYALLVVLLLVGVMNLALTAWILWVMDFSVHGMGKLRITDDGVKLDGDAVFLQKLQTSHIEALKGSSLNVYSTDNLTLSATHSGSRIVNKITLGGGKCVANVKRFQIRNKEGNKLFTATENKVTVGAEQLQIQGSGDLILNRSLQTLSVKSLPHSNLRVESPTRGVYINARGNLELKSSLGAVSIASTTDLTLKSLTRSIQLSARNVTIKGLQQLNPFGGGKTYNNVFQLCVCGNTGLMFLSPPSRNCAATGNLCS